MMCWDEQCVRNLKKFRETFINSKRRVVDSCSKEVFCVFTDASFEDDRSAGLGAILFDEKGRALDYFSTRLLPEDCDRLFSSDREQLITELKALAVLAALCLWHQRLVAKHVVIFCDNEGAKGAILKGYSPSKWLHEIACKIAAAEEAAALFIWYSRVPSESNPADDPSRHALSRPPALLAIQLGRFQYNGRRTIKVRTPCDIPLMLELPVFRDDQLGCSSRAYRLCGGIVHIGDLATSGHYRPFCVHNAVQSSGSEVSSPNDATTMFGPYTLYDDDKPPSTSNPSSDNLLRHNTYVVFYLCTRRDGRRNSEPGLRGAHLFHPSCGVAAGDCRALRGTVSGRHCYRQPLELARLDQWYHWRRMNEKK